MQNKRSPLAKCVAGSLHMGNSTPAEGEIDKGEIGKAVAQIVQFISTRSRRQGVSLILWSQRHYCRTSQLRRPIPIPTGNKSGDDAQARARAESTGDGASCLYYRGMHGTGSIRLVRGVGARCVWNGSLACTSRSDSQDRDRSRFEDRRRAAIRPREP